MSERFSELQKKEVIDISNGKRLGFLYDIQVNLESGRIEAFIVPARNRFLSFFWKYEEFVIPFDQITKIGDDIVLFQPKEQEIG